MGSSIMSTVLAELVGESPIAGELDSGANTVVGHSALSRSSVCSMVETTPTTTEDSLRPQPRAMNTSSVKLASS